MVLYSSTKFGILKPWTNIQSLRRFDFDLWQTSKQVYRKLKYSEKVFEEFQGLLRFPRKNSFVYSSTEFGILKPWTNIQSLRRFDLGFWKTSKQIYRKLQHRKKVFEELKVLSRFPRKMILYSSTRFGILKPWTNISWPRRFDLGIWQTSKQINRKLQYREKVFGEFKALPRFPRKMVLYSSTKCGILKPWTNI